MEFLVKTAAAVIPVLYTLGHVYVDSYWQALHLPSSLMNYTTEDCLYYGFASLVLEIARLIGIKLYTMMTYTFFLSFLVAALTMVAIIVDRWISKRMRDRIAVLQQRVREAKSTKYGGVNSPGASRHDRVEC